MFLRVLLCSGFLLIHSLPVRAQDTSGSPSRLENLAYVAGATATFSLLDYVAYNLTINTRPANERIIPMWLYRGVQGLTQLGISYALYKLCGLKSAIAFNVMWWTWWDDLAYYGYCQLFNVAYPWPNRNYRDDLAADHITWAGWTPVGLLRSQGSRVPRETLYTQALVGLAVSVAIIW